MDSNICNLVFDMGGVLVDLDLQRCVEAFGQLGFKQAEGLVQSYRQSGIFLDLEMGNISSEVFCQSIRHEAHRQVSDGQIVEAWNQMLIGIPMARLAALVALRKRYRVFLLSNTNTVHWQCCRKMFRYGDYGVEDYFDDLFLSFEMHLNKPDHEIFRSVINRACILPHETLLIDDSEANCAAARSMGWQTHHVQPGEDWTQLFT